MKSLLQLLLALGLSALLFWFGSSMHPVWWCMWLAPLPVLWIAARVKAAWAFGAASLVWLIGALSSWHYYSDILEMPLPAILTIILGPSLIFGLAVLLWRRLLLRGALIQAALALSCVMVVFCFALQRLSPHSTWGNPAYTQMDFLLIVQIASVTGINGVLFLLMGLPAALAAAAWGKGEARHRLVTAGSAVLLGTAVIAWGVYRLSAAPGELVKVGLVASNFQGERPPAKEVAFAGYAGAASKLVKQGAQLVVLPEKIVRVTDAEMADLEVPLREAARLGAVIAVGVERWSTQHKLNEVRVYEPPGELREIYTKHHMLPAFESHLLVGTERTMLGEPRGNWGVAICKDMDFPLLSREYGNDGIGLMIVPAWDFVADGWLHSRMAVMRGVESGFSLARAATAGLLTLSDSRGRVLAEASNGAGPFNTLLAGVPVHHEATVYARWGDWFSWLMTAVLLGAVVNALRPVRIHPVTMG